MSGDEPGVTYGGQDVQGSLVLAREAVADLQRSVAACPLQHRRLARDMLDAATLANARIQDVSVHLDGEETACTALACTVHASAQFRDEDTSALGATCRTCALRCRSLEGTPCMGGKVDPPTCTRLLWLRSPPCFGCKIPTHPLPSRLQAAVLRMAEPGVIVHAAFSLMQAARQARLQVSTAGQA